jgi:hypothetical protein
LDIDQTSDVFGGACGGYDVFSDGHYFLKQDHYCFEPVLHGGMENLYHYHPEATILLVTRNVDDWVSSVNRWFRLGDRVKEWCRGPGYFEQWQGKAVVTNADLAQLYRDHGQMVRSFAQTHPSIKFIEVQLESNETGAILEERIGISRNCWSRSNTNVNNPPTRNE